MPLSDNLPVIDDRRYADLVAEARTRIPRYTPEWNDLNDNEPGIAVVQLLCWLSEMLLFRLGQVPKLNYIKFLELLGIELMPAVPARAEITFTVIAGSTEPTVIVPQLTQVAADVPGADSPVVFETQSALIALAARLDTVLLDSGFDIVDVSGANLDGQTGFTPFGSAARIGAAVLFGFDSTLDFPGIQLDLMVWIKPPRIHGSFYVASTVATRPPAAIAWEYWNGAEWITLDLIRDDTMTFSRSGHVLLLTPGSADVNGPLLKTTMGTLPNPRYWIRARLLSGDYQFAPQLSAVRTNTITSLQAQSVDSEVLGRATGLDDQVFRLANQPVLDGTLKLTVDEGDGDIEWTEVEDFFSSMPDDCHYVLDRTTAEVRFGRGAALRVPIANPNNPANVTAQHYRFGGGKLGNVGAGKLTDLRASIQGIDSDGISNLVAATGGGDEETLDEAQNRAQETLKSHERAVTAEDFELQARSAGGVARAKALPLFNPQFPGVQVPGVVSVIVVPDTVASDVLTDPAPMPTEATLRTVCAVLDQRRLATTELYALAPTYTELVVTATITAKSDADLASIKQRAILELKRFFHPLIGGDDVTDEVDGSGWPFGGDVFYSAVVQRLMFAGVRRVNNLVFTLDGEPAPACSDATIAANALIKSGAHQISVQYET